MFNLFKKKTTFESSGVFRGFIDYHSHILPGVDDGVRKMEDSLAILQEYEHLGIEEVWCTPHIMEDIPNTTSQLRERFAELQEAYNGTIVLHLAAEYMLDNLFAERLTARDILPLDELSHDKILVETSYFNPPFGLMHTLDDIKSKGYYPVLAHPERYMYMQDENYYKNLKQKGVLFQLNIGSTCGVYGKTAKQKADMLIKNDYYNYKGTDLHGMDLLQMIRSSRLPDGLQLGYGY